jgi:hypothetical protein
MEESPDEHRSVHAPRAALAAEPEAAAPLPRNSRASDRIREAPAAARPARRLHRYNRHCAIACRKTHDNRLVTVACRRRCDACRLRARGFDDAGAADPALGGADGRR